MSLSVTSTRASHAARRTLVTMLSALALAACGGAARDADGGEPGADAPAAFVFPEGGVDFDGPVGLSSVPYAIDRNGAFWFVGCGGLYVIHDGQARFYDSTTSAVPESMSFIYADANDRIWISAGAGTNDQALGVFERGRYRTVLTSSELFSLSVSTSGVVWSYRPDSKAQSLVIRQVAPTLGEPLALPASESGFRVVTDRDGALWLTDESSSKGKVAYRWANGAWSEPLALDSFALQYEVEQDVLWAYVDANAREVQRVRWNGAGIEQTSERGLADSKGTLQGFGAGGRQVWTDDDELLWAEDGAVIERQPLPSDADGVRVSWDGDVYIFTPGALYRQRGDERSWVLDLERFGGECP